MEIVGHGIKYYKDKGIVCPECESDNFTRGWGFLLCLECQCSFKPDEKDLMSDTECRLLHEEETNNTALGIF